MRCKRWRFSPWAGKIPWRRKWQPTPVLLPGKSHGRRSLAGYSPWGRRESGMPEWLSIHTTSEHRWPKCALGKSETFFLHKNSFSTRKQAQDFPGGPVAKILPASEGNTCWPPSGKMPQATGQLRLRATATEQAWCRPCLCSAPEKPPQWRGARLPATRESKACVQLRRPGAAKNINFFFKRKKESKL